MHAFLSLSAEHEMGLSLPNILIPGAWVPPIQVLKQSSGLKAHWTRERQSLGGLPRQALALTSS